jgi:hypothetical protein
MRILGTSKLSNMCKPEPHRGGPKVVTLYLKATRGNSVRSHCFPALWTFFRVLPCEELYFRQASVQLQLAAYPLTPWVSTFCPTIKDGPQTSSPSLPLPPPSLSLLSLMCVPLSAGSLSRCLSHKEITYPSVSLTEGGNLSLSRLGGRNMAQS